MPRIGNRGEMEAFVRSLELGSFSAAARELRLSPSTLSKLVTRLEAALKVKLVYRNTRRVTATTEGSLFRVRCRRILDEMEDAEIEVGRSRDRPQGRLRMHMGVGFGASQGVHALPRFFERHRDVELDLLLEDRPVDLLQENVDISTWSFPPYAANVIARKLFDFERFLCASPEYLRRHGIPKSADDLARHRCMVVTGVPNQSPWIFQAARAKREVDVVPQFSVNNAACKYEFALAGMGIGQFSEYIVADALRDGRLIRLLEDSHRPPPLTQYVVYARDRHRLPRVAAMVEFLQETFGTRPWRKAPFRSAAV